MIKKVSTQPKFSIWMRRETVRDDSQPWIGDRKKFNCDEKRCGATKCWTFAVQLSFSCLISLNFRQLDLKSLYFSLPLCEGWILLSLIRGSKSKNASLKWQSPCQIRRVEQQNQSVLANCSDCTLNSHYPLWLLDTLPVHLPPWFHCALRSASFEKFLHSLTLPHYHYCISLCSAQNTTPEGILSLCWCSLILTLTTSMGIWYNAGATESWLQSPRWSKSFALIEKRLSSTEIFHLDDKRNAQRSQSNTNYRHKKNTSWRVKGYGVGTREC